MRTRLGKSLWRWAVFLAVAAVVAAAGRWGYLQYSKPTAMVTRVVQAPIVQAFYATGTLLPDREHVLRSNVEGTITQVLADKGSKLKQGQPVATVRVEEYILRQRQAQADLDLAKQLADAQGSPLLREYDQRLVAVSEQLEIARRDMERLTPLRNSGATSAADVDRAEDRIQNYWKEIETIKAQRAARLLALERDVKVAQAALDIAQWNLDQQQLTAPIDGTVLDRPLPVGARVKINDAILVMADIRPQALLMRSQVDEEDKTRTSVGQAVRATLYAYPGRTFAGKVTRIYPKADADRRTFEVDVTLEPVDEGFSAGMTGELAFIVSQKEAALVVPAQAVHAVERKAEKGFEVWLVGSDGQVRRQAVQVGLRSVERVEILEGVKEGERVIISPLEEEDFQRSLQVKVMEPVEAAELNRKPEEKAGKGFN